MKGRLDIQSNRPRELLEKQRRRSDAKEGRLTGGCLSLVWRRCSRHKTHSTCSRRKLPTLQGTLFDVSILVIQSKPLQLPCWYPSSTKQKNGIVAPHLTNMATAHLAASVHKTALLQNDHYTNTNQSNNTAYETIMEPATSRVTSQHPHDMNQPIAKQVQVLDITIHHPPAIDGTNWIQWTSDHLEKPCNFCNTKQNNNILCNTPPDQNNCYKNHRMQLHPHPNYQGPPGTTWIYCLWIPWHARNTITSTEPPWNKPTDLSQTNEFTYKAYTFQSTHNNIYCMTSTSCGENYWLTHMGTHTIPHILQFGSNRPGKSHLTNISKE